MIWKLVILYTIGTFIFYFFVVRGHQLRGHEWCELFLLRHMMRDDHPLRFMFVGSIRNYRHPRLVWLVITFYSLLFYCAIGFVCAGILEKYGIASNKDVINIFAVVSCVGYFAAFSIMLIPTIQNNRCFKEMMKMSWKEKEQINKDIEQKWPGFFDL